MLWSWNLTQKIYTGAAGDVCYKFFVWPPTKKPSWQNPYWSNKNGIFGQKEMTKADEKLCLQWNDFKDNARLAIEDLT